MPEKRCAYPGCTTAVNQDCYCYGCKVYICPEHDKNPSHPMVHEPERHWTHICPDCGEDETCCSCADTLEE